MLQLGGGVCYMVPSSWRLHSHGKSDTLTKGMGSVLGLVGYVGPQYFFLACSSASLARQPEDTITGQHLVLHGLQNCIICVSFTDYHLRYSETVDQNGLRQGNFERNFSPILSRSSIALLYDKQLYLLPWSTKLLWPLYSTFYCLGHTLFLLCKMHFF